MNEPTDEQIAREAAEVLFRNMEACNGSYTLPTLVDAFLAAITAAKQQQIPLFEMALAITRAQRDALLLAAAVETDEEAE